MESLKSKKVRLSGTHHPYCAVTYMQRDDYRGCTWTCKCELLRTYDKWRHDSGKSGSKKD